MACSLHNLAATELKMYVAICTNEDPRSLHIREEFFSGMQEVHYPTRCAMLLPGRLQDRRVQVSLFTASMHEFSSKMWPSGRWRWSISEERSCQEWPNLALIRWPKANQRPCAKVSTPFGAATRRQRTKSTPMDSMMSQQVLKPRSPSSLLAAKVQGRVFTSGHRRGGNVRPSVRSIVRAQRSSSDEVPAVLNGRMDSRSCDINSHYCFDARLKLHFASHIMFHKRVS